MLVITVDNDQGIRLQTPDGDLIGRIIVSRTKADRIRVACDLPQDIRIIRETTDIGKEAANA